jgi:autotransporter-associated beta strand protein
MHSLPASFVSRKFGLALLLASGASLQAADIFKAPNALDLGSTESWIGGALPTDVDVAVWDSSVPAATAAPFSVNASWKGLRITGNNSGQVIDSFSTFGTAVELTLGSSGLDAGSVTSGSTFLLDTPTVFLRSRTSQTWTVGDGGTIQLFGPLRRGLGDAVGGPPPVGNGFSGGSHVHFDLLGTGAVKLEGGIATYVGGTTANTIIPGATIGSGAGLDFAAMNSSKNVVPLHSLSAVGIPNSASVTALPGAGTFQTVPLTNLTSAASPAMGSATSGQNLASVLNVVNQRQTSGANSGKPVTGVALANGWIPQGLRFSVPRLGSDNPAVGYDADVPATYGDWTVNIPSGTVTMPTGFMVTSGVGKSNVILNGAATTLRIGNTPWLLSLHQDNAAADFIINTATISSTHTANSSVLKTGAGRVIVTSNYNHTVNNASVGGGLAIHGGIYQVGNNTAAGNLPLGTIGNQASLVFNRTGTLAVTNVITGSGSLTNNGSGDIQLSGASDYTGATNFNAGTVTLLGASALGNGGALNFAGGKLVFGSGIAPDLSARSITFASGTSILDVGANNVLFANVIGGAGSGALTKAGVGRLTLAGANSYTGGTSVAAGTLEVTNTGGSGTGTGAVTVGGAGTLAGSGSIAGAVSTSAGSKIVPGSSGVGDLTVGGLALAAGAKLEVEINPLGGNDRILVQASDGLTLNGGEVTLFEAGGTSQFSTPGTYDLIQYSGAIQGAGANSLTVVNPVAGYDYTFSTAAGTLSLSVAQGAVLSNWTPTAGGSWGDSGSWSNGLPSGNFIARLNTELTAPASITLDGNRSVAGLVFSSAQGYTLASGSPANSTLTLSNGSRSASIAVNAGAHTISAPVALSSPLSVATDAGTALSLTGVVSGSASIVKSGPGRLALTAANTFSGSVTVNGGVLAFALPTSLGTGSSITLDGATLEYGAGNTADLSGRSLVFGVNGATIDTNGNDVVYASAIGGSGAGRLTKSGAGSLSLLAASTFTGGVRVTAGELSIGTADHLGSGPIELDGGVLDITSTLSLPGAQPVSLGAAGGTIAAAVGTTVTLSGAVQNVVGATGALTLSGPGAFVFGVSNLHTGGTTLNAGASASFAAGLSPFGTGSVTLANGSLTTPTLHVLDANPLVVSGSSSITVGNNGSLGTVSGTGTLLVSSPGAAQTVNFTGTHAGFDGELIVAGSSFTRFNGTSIGGANVLYTINAGSILVRRSTAATIALGGLAGAGTLRGGQTTADTVNFQIGAKNLDTVFAGTIIDGDTQTGLESTRPVKARITKLGTGAFTLSGASTYTSTTTVDAGTLLVDGSIASTEAVTVNPAGTLGGAGTIAGPVTVAGTLRTNPTGLRKGTLALGSSLDLAIFNAETSSVTTKTRFDFGGTTAHRVVGLSVAGTLNYGGALEIAIPGTTFNGAYQLFAPATAPSGAFDSVTILGAADAVVATLVNDGFGVFTGTNGAIGYTFTAATGSLAITGAATPAGVPSAPVVTATPGNAQVALSWTATGSTYDVFRSETAGTGHTLVADDIATAAFTDTGLTNGTAYFYYVVAANDAGTSPASTEVSATPGAVMVNPLQSWRQTYFGTTANTGNAADAFDFDNDGRSNLLEYAVGSVPTVADSGPGYTVAAVAGQLRITFNRIDDPALTYTVQGRDDLTSGTWTTVVPVAGNNPINGFTGTQAGVLETESVTVVDPVVLGPSAPRRFLRLQVGY